jgi:hypothetical protein
MESVISRKAWERGEESVCKLKLDERLEPEDDADNAWGLISASSGGGSGLDT